MCVTLTHTFDPAENKETEKEEDGGMFGKIGGFGSGLMGKAGSLNPMSGDKDLEALEKKLADAADGEKEAIQKEIDEHKAKKEEGGGGMFGGFSMPSVPSIPNPMGGDKDLEALEKKLADAADGEKEAIQKEIDEHKAKKEEGGGFGGFSMPSMPDMPKIPNPMEKKEGEEEVAKKE